MCWKMPHALVFPGFQPCWEHGETRGSGRSYWFPVCDTESWPSLGACPATPWCSVLAPDHQARHTEIPKGFLCWEGICHSTSPWCDRTLNTGASPLPCSARCLFLGKKQLWDLQTCLVMVKLSLFLISSGMGLKIPPRVWERTGLHYQVMDLNSSSLACCLS